VKKPPLWICPRCGARLVRKHLSHSCGTFALEALFTRSEPQVLELARRYVAVLAALGDVQVLPQRTRLVGVARVRFAQLLPRKDHLIAGFALHRGLKSNRVIKTEDYGPRWRYHFVAIRSDRDLDDQLGAWLRESYEQVGLQSS
jgi:hypothetical protein